NNSALNPTLVLAGNITNSGKLYLLSTDAQSNNAVIGASNIFNHSGGLISSALPKNGVAGFSGTAIASLNLSLTAVNDIVNHGIIRISGDLPLTAGGTIANQTTAGGSPATILGNSISLSSAAGNILNSGVIAALAGNMNVNAHT